MAFTVPKSDRIGSGDAEVDSEMNGLRRDFGSDVAEGRSPKGFRAPAGDRQGFRTPDSDRPATRQAGVGTVLEPQETPGPSTLDNQLATQSRLGYVAPGMNLGKLSRERFIDDPPPDSGMLGRAAKTIGTGVDAAMGWYEENVGKPYRKMMFKEDPLETMARRDPGPDAPIGEQLMHGAKTLAAGMLADPLAGLGGVGRSLGAARRLPQRPKLDVPPTPAVQPGVALTAPIVSVPEPSIQELAQAHTLSLGSREPRSGSPQAGYRPHGIEPGVETNPSGSVVRPGTVLDPQQVSQYTGPELSTTPSGSMVRVRPEEKSVVENVGPVERHQPPLPQPLVGHYSDAIPESRMMHGAPPGLDGPPKPFLRSAEDLLAEKLAARGEVAPLELPDIPAAGPKLDEMLLSPDQLGPRGPVGLSGHNVTRQADGRTLSQAPLTWRRVVQSAYDTLDQMGQYSRQLGDIYRHSWDYSESGTRQNFLDYVGLVKQLYGSRSLSKKVDLALHGEWSNLLNRSIRDFGLSQKEVDALVELHEIGGDLSKASPKALESLPLRDPRIQKLYDEGWKILTGRASNHPAIQRFGRVVDRVTGEQTPVGPASPYWPHQPVNENTKELLSRANLQRIYKERGYADKLEFHEFERMMSDFINNKDEAVQLRRYAGIEDKRLLNALEDAKSHSRTVADTLRHYGYETDPLRALLRHNVYTYKRAVFLENEGNIKELMAQLATEYGVGSKEYKWINKVHNLTQGISPREDMLTKSSDAVRLASALTYPSFLKAAWSQNFLLQPVHVFAQTGLKPIAQAIFRRFGKSLGMTEQDILDAANKSAASFPADLAKYHAPGGVAEQYNKTANILNLFSVSDAWTRTLTGEVGIPHVENLIKQWWREPGNPKNQKLLRELNINPDELYKRMSAVPRAKWEADGIPKIPDAALIRGAQTLANSGMGRTGIRSSQLWASGTSDAHKLMMMLHRQLTSNEATFYRTVFNAPTAGEGIKRALRYMFGAEVAGALYQGVINWTMGNNFFDVNEPLAKSFGNNKEAAFAVKSLLLGLGTFTAGLMLSGLNLRAGNYGGTTYGVLSPPAATFVDEIMTKLAQGKFEDAAMRVQPSEILDKAHRRQKKEESKRKRGGGLTPNLGLDFSR